MGEHLFALLPEEYRQEHFLQTIGRRNRWLIKLRFGAFGVLFVLSIVLLFFNYYIAGFSFDSFPLIVVSLIILIYNLFFLKFSKILDERHRKNPKFSDYMEKYRFHDLHFSLLQITADFLALMFFIHFTGGVETPLFVFFFFHVIIGSLILPGSIMFLIVTMTLLFTAFGAWLEYSGIVAHYHLNLFPFELYDNPVYLFVFFISFAVGLYLATYLANSIAKELYRRESRLAKTLLDLEEAERIKSQYVMTIVHDLKTPIAAATTYVNMIIDGTLGEINPAQKKPLERIKYRLDNAINTINDVLYISKLKAESNIEDVVEVDLIDIFNQIYNEMRILIKSKNLSFEFEYDDRNNFTVQAEKKLLKLALANLISNSVKYTDEYGKIIITLKEQSQDVHICIADNGIGIPEKEQKKIFTDFFRSSISKSKGIEGTGLGLSFVKEVIERHNGQISMKSPSYLYVHGRPGTQFDIILQKNFSII
jgi:signal transduction histidine kinase